MAHKRRRVPHTGRGARKKRTLLEGTLHVVRPGSAYVETSEGSFRVARSGVREGMDGDEVQISTRTLHGRGGERIAYVQSVTRRAMASFLGTYAVADPLGVVSPLDVRIGHDFFVVPQDRSAERLGVGEGDVVRARIVEYPTRRAAGVATIERRLGTSTELDMDIEAVIASHGLATEFSEAVLAEARDARLNVEGALSSDHLRRDLRDELCLTVDPADARDFDDAVAARRLEDGGFEVCVHIADVTHYVRWDGPMDVEARHRTCSVYLADRVIPMLPERLCNDLCSLRPGEDRLAMTVRMRLDAAGHVRDAEAYPSVIHSRARLSYDQVDALFAQELQPCDLPCATDADPEAVANMLFLLDEVAHLRLAVRRARGAIDFAMSESKVELDEDGHPVGMVTRARTRATSLIEEAMLIANESVARMLADRNTTSAYRVHERPSPEDLAGCVPALREQGLLDAGLADRLVAADPYAIQDVLSAAEGTTGEFVANTFLLRAQKRALYLPHNEGHYALGASAYCHFTSPIRRYPDVMVHRALKNLLEGGRQTRERTQMEAALPQLCRTCSDRERVADLASRESQDIKTAELFSAHVGEKYAGVVVGCIRSGLFVRLDESGAEGFVPVRALGDEWFGYSEARMALTGESTGTVWHLGKRVAVTVAGTDIPRGRIDFALAQGKRRA